MDATVNATETHLILCTSAARQAAQWLSDPARERCVVGAQDVHLPWSVALVLRELAEDETRHAALIDHLPGWLSADDIDALTEVLVDASLPEPTVHQLRLRARGTAGRAGYRLTLDWVDARGLVLRPQPAVMGGVLACGQARLSAGQRRLLDRHGLLPPLGEDRTQDLLVTAQLKAVVPADDRGVCFDRFLARESVVHAHRVEPYLAPVDGGYQVRPRIEGVDAEALERHYFCAGTPGANVLSVRDGAHRQRVVFSDQASAALDDLRRIDRLTPEQAATALSRPEAFFGPNIDTTRLSERVVGLGPDVRTPTPTRREIKPGVWFDRLDLEVTDVDQAFEATDQDAGIDLSDPTLRSWLRSAIDGATARGDRFIALPDRPVLIELTAALMDALANAERQALRGEVGAQQVLQVRDNIEAVEYAPGLPALPMIPPMQARPHRVGPRGLSCLSINAQATAGWCPAVVSKRRMVRPVVPCSPMTWDSAKPCRCLHCCRG